MKSLLTKVFLHIVLVCFSEAFMKMKLVEVPLIGKKSVTRLQDALSKAL